MIAENGIIFRSENLLIRATPGAGDVAFVSFDCYTEQDGLDRPGFGEAFFQGLGLPAFHVIHRRNRWFQYPELPAALAALRQHLAGYRKVVAYGSSMGGFAALTYGRAIGAHIGLALSPQFSVDPRIAPFEHRWRADVARIRFLKAERGPSLPCQYIAFDPADRADARHAAMFAERSPTILLPVRFGGHPVGAFLNEVGALRLLIERLASAGIAPGGDAPAIAAEVIARCRAGRTTSGQYLYSLARCIPPHRLRTKLAVAEKAGESGNPVYRSYHAALLDSVGRHDEAVLIHRQVCAHPDPNPAAFWNLIAHHIALGREAEAERVAREGLRLYPRSPQLRRKLRWLIARRVLRLNHIFPMLGLSALRAASLS